MATWPPLLRVSDLQTHYTSFGGAANRQGRRRDQLYAATKARRSGSSANRAAARPRPACRSSGCSRRRRGSSAAAIEFDGEDLTKKRPREMRRIRGRQIAMILQDPMASLNPLFSIYWQVAEPAYYHQGMRGRSLRQRVQESAARGAHPLARRCGCANIPHQMSGGMRQRVVGAIAMAGGPKLIIADEPTTNLDVTIQAQYLDVLKDIQQRTGVALIFVTHNLGIVAKMCDKMAVMYAGKIVEQGSVRDLFRAAKHPYTQALLGSMPKLGSKEPLYAIPGQPPNLAQLPARLRVSPALRPCDAAMRRAGAGGPVISPRIGRHDAGWSISRQRKRMPAPLLELQESAEILSGQHAGSCCGARSAGSKLSTASILRSAPGRPWG